MSDRPRITREQLRAAPSGMTVMVEEWRRKRIAAEAAAADFNGRSHADDAYARLPVLATDCDYEIVRRSGVQGVRL